MAASGHRADGDDERLSANAARDILDEIDSAVRKFFRGGLEEWARGLLPGQEDLFHRKLGPLLTRILTVITENKDVQRLGDVWSRRKHSESLEELRIAVRASWNCLRHVDVTGVTFRSGNEVMLSTLTDVQLKALRYFDLSLKPLPYERKDVGFIMPSGTAIFVLDNDGEDWRSERRFTRLLIGDVPTSESFQSNYVTLVISAATRTFGIS